MSGKKFRFSLRRVLDLRRHATDRAQLTLAEARAAQEAQAAQVERARAQAAERHRTRFRTGRVGTAQLRQAEAFRHDARRRLATARAALSIYEERVRQARTALQACRQAEEGLEKLREREKQQHEDAQAKAARAFLDEQAVLRHGRDDAPLLLSRKS